eukprot:snap_masked-scaffold_26-processed-gene-3.36-mRNA-1 protein AED:1.00 eAED:1.00 QI:0/0/0/0/1/1/6/0/130
MIKESLELNEKFKRDIKEFVKGFQPTQEVSSISFEYCPFHALKSIFLRFILCFPAVKELSCRFSNKNFRILQKLKKFSFSVCNIPEVNSFCSLIKSINIKDIQLLINNFSAKYIPNIFKSLSSNKHILKI